MWVRMMEALGLNKQRAHLRRWSAAAKRIGALEPELTSLDEAGLRARVVKIRKACENEAQAGLGKRDSKLEEVFALGREASRRLLGLRHFDVQLVGAMALHEGKLAEMRTGEGKSLCLTLAAIYNSLSGAQTHIVTVNEYLARRDAQGMASLYAFFGLQVGLLEDGQDLERRKAEYGKDVIYGVNHDFGFDYLRHNMARTDGERRMARGLNFAIVDEVDSILIDEARTPLIISGNENDDLAIYAHCWRAASSLVQGPDLEVDEKKRTVVLSEQGFEKLESMFMKWDLIAKGHHLYEIQNNAMLRALQACLQARFLFHKDQHYIVKDGKVLIVDENTGRLMPDRRWSNGFHQAVEAKEGVEVLQESKTLATITYQNFFGLYGKLSGLTGTALTQAAEFWSIYGLEVVAIPTHMPMIRKDRPDVVYRSENEKFKALALEAKKGVEDGRPVLAGTSNIEESEKLSAELEILGVAHKLLNAKNHEREALIVEEAGLPKRVTVATNMAGRGTDIVLGGSWSAIERELADQNASEQAIAERELVWREDKASIVKAGGLLVLGCARNESRRVDNQLRGRGGRQGDPGESKFFISLDDNLFRIYAQNGMLAMIDKYNMMPEGSCLEHPMLNRSLDKAQAAVENHHYDMRKQLQDFDGVGAEQRKIVYAWRDEIIDAPEDSAWDMAHLMIEQAVDEASEAIMAAGFIEAWSALGAKEALEAIGELPEDFEAWIEQADNTKEVKSRLAAHWKAPLEEARQLGLGNGSELKAMILERIDDAWQEHLTTLQNLLDGIHLRSYAQKEPKQEYKREGYEMFARLRGAIVVQAASGLIAWARQAKTSLMESAMGGEPLFSSQNGAQPHWLEQVLEEKKQRWSDGIATSDGVVYAMQAKAASKSQAIGSGEDSNEDAPLGAAR